VQTSKKGFGTELMTRELKAVLKGSVKLGYTGDGLEAVLTIPVEASGIGVASE
jgi:hypothetical protein